MFIVTKIFSKSFLFVFRVINMYQGRKLFHIVFKILFLFLQVATGIALKTLTKLNLFWVKVASELSTVEFGEKIIYL